MFKQEDRVRVKIESNIPHPKTLGTVQGLQLFSGTNKKYCHVKFDGDNFIYLYAEDQLEKVEEENG